MIHPFKSKAPASKEDEAPRAKLPRRQCPKLLPEQKALALSRSKRETGTKNETSCRSESLPATTVKANNSNLRIIG
jgi:hypothetical protein